MMDVNAAGDELRSPWDTIPRLLENYDGSDHARVFSAVAEHFSSRFGSQENLQNVPVLTSDTAETIPANSLVRYRGMIVDMFNPEFFLGAYKRPEGGPWRPAALYTDDIPADIEAAAETKIFERRPLLVTAVPAEQPWATAAWAGRPVEPPTPCATDRPKRSREYDPLQAAAPSAAAAADDAIAQTTKFARLTSDTDVDVPFKEVDAVPTSNTADQNGGALPAKHPQTAAAAVVDQHQEQQPGYCPGDCIVQVYEGHDRFQLHDVVEVLGIMIVVPALAAMHMVQDQQQQQHGMEADGNGGGVMDVDDFWQERSAVLPPTSQVLRLHALAIRKVTPNPYSSSSMTAAAAAAVPRLLPGHIKSQLPVLRQRAIQLLTAPLAGDELAAEYLLLAALGSVVNRQDGAVGMLTLNLTQCPSTNPSSSSSKACQVIPGLAAALRCLLPHVALLPVNVTTLNNTRWYPQQHAATGRLFRGLLQLSEGTLLLLDETEMAAGQLGDNGVKNLQAIRQVLTQQQLPCNCQVYTHNLNVNQPAVVLSTGRSVFRDNLPFQLPLQPQRPVLVKPQSDPQAGQTTASLVDWSMAEVAGVDEITTAAAGLPELAAVREYFATARGGQCSMDQAAAEACVAKFRSQQQIEPGLGLEDLNNIITLSKLLAVSHGHEVFSLDSWDRAMQLEQMRKQRLAATYTQ